MDSLYALTLKSDNYISDSGYMRLYQHNMEDWGNDHKQSTCSYLICVLPRLELENENNTFHFDNSLSCYVV